MRKLATELSVGDIVYLVAKGQQNLSAEEFSSIARMACKAADRREALLSVYEIHGPGAKGGSVGEKEPVASYATMTEREIDETWDFDSRHLMQKVAKAIAE